MNTVNTVAMAPGDFGDGKKPPPTSLGSQQVPLHFNFRRFGVCGFHGLAAIRKSLVHKNLDISVYARYSGWPNDVMHRKMALVILTLPAIPLLSSYYSSFAIVRFSFAGCGVCIPTFAVPKCGNMPDHEKVGPQLMAAAARKAGMWKGTRE